MTRTKALFLAPGLLAAVLFAPARAQEVTAPPATEELVLRLKLEKGARFGFRHTLDMKQDMDMGGRQMSTTLTKSSEYAYEVLDVAESGDSTLKLELGRIKGALEHPMAGSLEFDSDLVDDQAANPMVSMFTANAGQELTVVLNATGEVVSIDGVEAMVDRILESNPMAGMSGLDAESMTTSLKNEIEAQFGQIPSDAVALGDTWTVERGMSGMPGIGVQLSITSALKGLTADEVEIASEMKGELADGPLAAMISVEKFTGTGHARHSLADGLPLKSTAKLEMTATMSAGPQGQGGIVLTLESTLERTAVERTKEPAPPLEAPPGDEPAEPPPDEE